ncbi:MAG: SBBP repeat-containing protein [Patescibacteria group bacterium]
MKKLLYAFVLFFCISIIFATTVFAEIAPVQSWAVRYNGIGNRHDYSKKIAVDVLGNVYVTGYSEIGYYAFTTIKYDTNGNQLWVAKYDNGGSDVPIDIVIDILGNVYITAGNGSDYITIKYDTKGNQLWVVRYDGGSSDYVKDLSIDTVGNVYVTGWSFITHSESIGSYDYVTVKYDTNGNQLWVAKYDNNRKYDFAAALSIDTVGNVYVTGWSDSVAGSYDYVIIKYDSNGNQLWVARYDNGGTFQGDISTSIVVDALGNVYVTGFSRPVTNPYPHDFYDFATVKYDTNGNQLWVARYDNKDGNQIIALTIDTSGNIYVSGRSYNDYITIKYNNNGNQIWVAKYDNGAGYRVVNTVDVLGNVYVTGGNSIIKYDYNGNQLWKDRYDGNAVDIVIDSLRNIYVTGHSYSIASGDDYLTVKYTTNNNFWSQIQNSSAGWLNLRKTPGNQNKPADDIIKTVPNGWAVKVASTTSEGGNYIDLDGYRWYKAEDVTDGVVGWMAAKSLPDEIIYLDYDFNNQSNLEQKATAQLDTSEKRKPIILQAVDNFYIVSTTNSLYSGGGGLDGLNNFQKFIQGANFLKEFVLAITAEESGPSFNNEICSNALDGGIGIIQITSLGFKGLGSGLYNKPKLTDCDKNTIGWTGNLSKYYSNAVQGIYANIKDGFRVLQEKYRSQCFEEVSGGLYFNCNDIRRILTIWGYNGFGDESGSYLNKIAARLETLSSYFSGIAYPDTDQFIQKLRKADRQKILALLKSPGELQIEDKNGNITGVVDSVIQENIPNSLYEKDYKGIAIFFPKNPYIYRVIGTSSGAYGFNVDFFNDDITQSFRAKDIPITLGEIHEYYIDWDALLNGEAGTTLQIDQNGDKIVDKTFISDETFEPEDIFLQSQTLIDFEPNVLNLESNGIATTYIELPIGCNINDIGTSSIRLNKVVHILSKPIEIGDYDKDGISDLMIKFERENIKSAVIVGEKIPIIITGKVLCNGNYYHFKGQDIIKIINNKAEIVPNSVVSRWALVQKIFNNAGEKVIAMFYRILK